MNERDKLYKTIRYILIGVVSFFVLLFVLMLITMFSVH